MIFIALFGFIAIVVISLNVYDEYNLKKIEEYINNLNCEKYIYSKGSYKALCEDRLLEIPNSFTVDVKVDKKEFIYADINSLDIDKKSIIINDKEKISFSKEEELNSFYKKLEKNLNK